MQSSINHRSRLLLTWLDLLQLDVFSRSKPLVGGNVATRSVAPNHHLQSLSLYSSCTLACSAHADSDLFARSTLLLSAHCSRAQALPSSAQRLPRARTFPQRTSSSTLPLNIAEILKRDINAKQRLPNEHHSTSASSISAAQHISSGDTSILHAVNAVPRNQHQHSLASRCTPPVITRSDPLASRYTLPVITTGRWFTKQHTHSFPFPSFPFRS